MRIPRGLVAVLLAQLVLLPSLALGAGAQEPDGAARLRLVDLPVSHAPDDPLGATLQIHNTGDEPLDGFNISVGASAIIRNRTDLHESFEVPPVAAAVTVPFQQRLAPGARTVVDVDTPVADLSLGFEDGVHALQFSLLTEESTFPIASLTTQLMVYSSTPQNPLELVPVVPLDAAPAQAPDGTFPAPDDEPNPMEAAVAERGWLAGLARALDEATDDIEVPEQEPVTRRGRGRNRQRRRPPPAPEPPAPLRITFAPTPRTLEEIAHMADGYERSVDGELEEIEEDARPALDAAEVLGALRNIARRSNVQSVLVPYSFPDLPLLEDSMPAVDIGEQLLEGATVLRNALGLSVDRRWVLPPGGRLDVSALQALQATGVSEGLFLSAESVRSLDPAEAGCPEPALSFVCPVRVETDVAPAIEGYAHDPQVQERLTELSAPGAGRLEVQRVLAETAMIHAELPGISGRVLYLNTPPRWHPRPGIATEFFNGLRNAPWLASNTASEGIGAADEIARRDVVDEAPLFPSAPSADYFAAIGTADERVASFSNFVAAREQRTILQRLRRSVLVAEGQTLWFEDDGIDRAAAYADDARIEADDEMAKVTLGVPRETTFTSRTGSLDVSLFNQTGYPVDVKVVLNSLDMTFDPDTFDRTFPPGTTRLSIGADAQSSGTFPIQVRVETDDGHLLSAESIQVRSTEFNIVALAITFGAVAFLILFYVTKALRRRRERTAEAPTH